ncbi:T9SS type A sorting domain-containing protein [Winogradskyella alexanderae]|uniref:T9SS type A sorting domain-containing protein n=1 Tax=Winogradskyella alexanderae TaxID=2877123 RepID=A0ABS7XQE4_9FLAO|nr:T9SS type A sorting domain-containing protein [Winogradskyella alexanderae]MCA0132227.1 T9SS type A sorting domain-containing protein [Winogradskyella alexanderae]
MKRTLLLFSTCLITFSLTAQVTLNQVDDFQDGTTQNWRIGGAGNATDGPINVTNGGPSGAGDNCLQYTSTGTAGVASKMVFFSQNNQWSGDFITQGIDQINFDVNVQTNALNLRIALQGSGTRICSTSAINVPATGNWSNITIPIDPSDFTIVSGGVDAATVLSNVQTLRILSSSTPTWDGPDVIAAIIQVDNILASSSLSIPEFQNQNTEFTISPNPGKNSLNIKLPTSNGDMKLEVFDVLGKRVYQGIITQLQSSVNVSNWRSGVYLVRVSNNESVQTKRFIKQ